MPRVDLGDRRRVERLGELDRRVDVGAHGVAHHDRVHETKRHPPPDRRVRARVSVGDRQQSGDHRDVVDDESAGAVDDTAHRTDLADRFSVEPVRVKWAGAHDAFEHVRVAESSHRSVRRCGVQRRRPRAVVGRNAEDGDRSERAEDRREERRGRAVGRAEETADVGESTVLGDLDGRLPAEVGDPVGRRRAAARRVDHQVGVEDLAVSESDPGHVGHTRNGSRSGDESRDRRAAPDGDVRFLGERGRQRPLDRRASSRHLSKRSSSGSRVAPSIACSMLSTAL